MKMLVTHTTGNISKRRALCSYKASRDPALSPKMKRKGSRDGRRSLRHLMSGIGFICELIISGFWINLRALGFGLGYVFYKIIFFIQRRQELECKAKGGCCE
jgi:hypothetical protein